MDKKDKDNISKFKTVIIQRPKVEEDDASARLTRSERKGRAGGLFRRGRSSQDPARGTRRARRPRFRKERTDGVSEMHDFRKAAVSESAQDDSFAANVRFSEPILNVTALSRTSVWRRDLPYNIAIGLLLLAFLSIFCLIIEDPLLIAFAVPSLVVFAALAMLDSFDKSNAKYIACGVIAVLLIASAVIFKSTVGYGLALLTDEFYDMAEDAQAYIYDRFPGGDSASDMDSRIAMMWISALLGTLMAAIPAHFRRTAGMLLTAFVMLALAYYGIVPSWISIGAVLLALLLTLSRDNLAAALPLMLAAAILFGAVTLIDPGEFYGISRVDENIRDRIAFHSALLESGTPEDENIPDPAVSEAQAAESENSPLGGQKASYIWIAAAVALVAAIAAAAYVLFSRFRKRQAAVRKGIDSKDPREAVTAMFPYSVRWLKASGIETRDEPFSGMAEDIRRVYESAYAGRFSEMYKLWREAAYSDHVISEADRAAMDRFTKDTVTLVSDKWNAGQKLRMRYKHAL